MILLSGYSLPNITDGASSTSSYIRNTYRSRTGKLYVDIMASGKYKATLVWEGVSEAERTDIKAAYNAITTAPGTLTLPNGDSYAVMATGDLAETAYYDGSDYFYNISFPVEEQ